MKGLKKMIAVVLTIAMVVTFVPQINFGVNADTAKKIPLCKILCRGITQFKRFRILTYVKVRNLF